MSTTTRKLEINAAQEIIGDSAAAVRRAYSEANDAGNGWEWESPEEGDENYSYLGSVDAGNDREIDVYETLDGKLYGVADVNGPWAVRLAL